MPEEGVDLGPQRIRVFISGNSGNKEMVTHQQRIIMVLQSLGIDTEVLDIAAPGMDEARDFMRGGAKKKENQRNVLPPQIFNGDTYCGDYDDFDVANEDDHLEEFLGIPKQGSDLKEGGDAVDGQDPTKLEGQPAVNGEPEKSEASKEDIEVRQTFFVNSTQTFILQDLKKKFLYLIECIFLSQGRHYDSFPDFTPSSDANNWCLTDSQH